MVKMLVAASLAWPLILSSAAVARWAHAAPVVSSVVYLAASRVCHQRPERSFHTAHVQWPVCARCSGLYLAAPAGAIVAFASRRRRSRSREPHAAAKIVWLLVASLPTAVTLALEWLRLAPMSNLTRAVAALPLGAMVAFLVVRVAGPRQPIE
jgi:uncharacterized membrane protein